MNVVEKPSLKVGRGAGLAALGVALTWFCCLPLALGSIGLGAAALGASMVPLRPWFTGAAVVLLGGAFYFRYRRNACRPGEVCSVASNRLQQLVLWTIAAVTLA